ncbi:aquaporin [Candidatus Saccharibacteria bacterium]|nr:aquaporin [Candidatus Saccharibacteria bacterium]
MAKSKKSGKKPKDKKPEAEQKVTKITAKAEEVEKAEVTTKAEKPEKAEKVVETKKHEKEEKPGKKKTGFWRTFFAKKYEGQEGILTIFKDKKLYGALMAEALGTMILMMIVLTLGLYQPLYMLFFVLIVTVAFYKLSGANLNPINTVGMMATRRMSVIRGVLYILAQILGAWLATLVMGAFVGASESGMELPGMADVADGTFWKVLAIEAMGAAMVGFFFARAQQYRKNSLAFGAIVGGGMALAMVVVYIVSYNYFGFSENFMLNPAMALMYQILPTAADSVGGLLGGIGSALLIYVFFPVLAGTIGFYLSDISSQLAEEK